MPSPQPHASTRPAHVLARGVLAVRGQYLAWLSRHPRLADAQLGALLVVVSLPPLTGLPARSRSLSLALMLAVATPLAWRRRAPLLVLLAMAVPALAQAFTPAPVTDYLAFLAAFFTVAACSPLWRVAAAAVVLESGAALAVVHLREPDGRAVWQWAWASALLAAAGLAGWYVRTTRRARLASLRERAEREERERDHLAQLSASAERARIAREMHDIVAHNIAVMIRLADGAAWTAASSPGQAASLMAEVSTAGRTALTEMRRLLGVLRQPSAPEAGHEPQPTLADLDNLLAAVRAAGLPVSLTVTGEPFPLPPSAQLALYRMTQEALTNVLKHAPGADTAVRLTYGHCEAGIEVTNVSAAAGQASGEQGVGPAAARLPGPGTGHGIAGMRERAALFGGEVTAGPCRGGGWRVRAVLDVRPAGAGRVLATGTDGV